MRIYKRVFIEAHPVMELVHEHDILDDAKHEEREKYEKACNTVHVENLTLMETMVRERLEDMFEIVKMHEKTNKDIKKDLRTAVHALRCDVDDKESYAEYKRQVVEITENKKSLFMAERARYLKRHSVRMQEFQRLLVHAEKYLDEPLLMDGARHKVLVLREIQKFRNGSALAQINKWDLTYYIECFEQTPVVDSTIVSHDAYKTSMPKNPIMSRR